MDDNDFIQELRQNFYTTYGNGGYKSYEDTSFFNSQEEIDNLIKIVIRGFTILLRELRKLIESNGSYSLEVIIELLYIKFHIRKVNGVLSILDNYDNQFQSENLHEIIEYINAQGENIPTFPISQISKITNSGKQTIYRNNKWTFLKTRKREIIRKNRVNAQKVISRNLREVIWNPNTTLGYNRMKRLFMRENEDIYKPHRNMSYVLPPRYEEVVKPKIKGIFRNPQTLEIETAYHFGKKKVRLNLKQLKKDLIFLKKIKV